MEIINDNVHGLTFAASKGIKFRTNLFLEEDWMAGFYGVVKSLLRTRNCHEFYKVLFEEAIAWTRAESAFLAFYRARRRASKDILILYRTRFSWTRIYGNL